MQEIDLKRRVAFITGASEGMGKATSFYLSDLGVYVVLAARRKRLTQEFASIIRQKSRTVPLAVKVNVKIEDNVRDAVNITLKNYGRIDFAANFAGNSAGYIKGDRRKPIFEQNIKHLKEIAEIDHFGTARVLKHLLPHMIKERFGKIVLVSAVTSVYGYSEDVDYIPYKRANEGLALSTALRSEKEEWGVEIYTIAPGDVFNPSTWDSYSEEEKIEAVKYGVIESNTVSKVVSWLFSGKLKERYEMKVNLDTGEVIDKGRYIPLRNGDIIVIDAKTAPKLFELVGERYKPFIPSGYSA